VIYYTLYPHIVEKVRERLRDYGRIHGSEVRDLFIRHSSAAVDDHAERLLTEMVESGELKVFGGPAPTHSQAAFIGLQYSQKAYKDAGWAPGLKEHFYYETA
jgi:hypothetical protein